MIRSRRNDSSLSGLSFAERFCKRQLKSLMATTRCSITLSKNAESDGAHLNLGQNKNAIVFENAKTSLLNLINQGKLPELNSVLISLNEPNHFHEKVFHGVLKFIVQSQSSLTNLNVCGWGSTYVKEIPGENPIAQLRRFCDDFRLDQASGDAVLDFNYFVNSLPWAGDNVAHGFVLTTDGNSISIFQKLRLAPSKNRLVELVDGLSQLRLSAYVVKIINQDEFEVVAVVSQKHIVDMTKAGPQFAAVVSKLEEKAKEQTPDHEHREAG